MKNEKTDGVIRFSISLEPTLLKKLDERIIHQGYASRSELVRDMIREKLIQEEWQDKDKINSAVLVLVYDHHRHELNQRIIGIQHKAKIKILCTTHIHTDMYNCLETIILNGKADEIQSFTFEIAGLKGVKFAKLTPISSFYDE